jgi:hypothetical protein
MFSSKVKIPGVLCSEGIITLETRMPGVTATKTIYGRLRRSWWLFFLVVLSSCEDSRCGQSAHKFQASTGSTYMTDFPAAENPISQNGRWIDTRSTSINWANVVTVPGLAYGTESGSSGYDDSTALLAGTWGSDQMAEATVHSVNQTEQTDAVFEEVELRLRSALTPYRATGYEINFRCLKTPKAYAQIVRWDGRFGKFTYLHTEDGAKYGVKDGDVVKATIVGNVITAYINGVQVLRATDNRYAAGSPGMGFYLQGTGASANKDFGFTNFKASDKF